MFAGLNEIRNWKESGAPVQIRWNRYEDNIWKDWSMLLLDCEQTELARVLGTLVESEPTMHTGGGPWSLDKCKRTTGEILRN